MSIFALAGVLLLILMFLISRRIKLTTRMLIYMSLMLAFAIILHQIRIYHFPQGGSVTAGGMIPLLLLSYRFGPGIGMLTGFAYGIILILQDPFLLHPVQVLFDYPLPYVALGIAGISSSHRKICTGLAFVTRFLCHFISGVVFFGSYAPEGMSPVLYSLAANASYLVPECMICALLLRFLPVKRFLTAMHT